MKRFLSNFVVLAVLVCILASCSSTVDEPCMYCNQSPSKEYAKSDGSKVYVCEDCSSECMLCHDNATKHYESAIGIVFVCDDCYNEVVKN